MSLTAYQTAILTAELAKSDYTGMTSDQAWAWLTQPIAQPPVTSPTGVMLTSRVVALAIGPFKANAIAAALTTAFPAIAPTLIETGVDPLDVTGTQAFLSNLVGAGVITQADMDKLVALGSSTVTPPPLRPRFDQRFSADSWPSVKADGTVDSTKASPPISGFPNSVERADFNTCWTAAGRS